jgi:hypothetical protein
MDEEAGMVERRVNEKQIVPNELVLIACNN